MQEYLRNKQLYNNKIKQPSTLQQQPKKTFFNFGKFFKSQPKVNLTPNRFSQSNEAPAIKQNVNFDIPFAQKKPSFLLYYILGFLAVSFLISGCTLQFFLTNTQDDQQSNIKTFSSYALIIISLLIFLFLFLKFFFKI